MQVFVDIETRSRVDLKKLGVYMYAQDCEVLMAAWSVDGGPVSVDIGEDDIRRRLLGFGDVQFIAHNAGFERVVLGARIDPALQDPERWDCTLALSAEYGYPTALDAVARALGAVPKDTAGKALIRLFTVPRRDGEWNTAETHPEEWLDFLLYCAQDVETMIDVHRRLGPWPTESERRVWVADQRINDRGMQIDLDLCRVAAVAVRENRVLNKEEFTQLTDVLNPASTQQVLAWAVDVGLDLPNLQAATVQDAIDDPATDPAHVRVLELRQDLALAAGGKFSAALDVVSPDSRIRGGFRFFGAHTGRWTGQRVQPQNLPRATIPEPEAAIFDLKLGLGATPHTLKALVRSMFVGPLTVVDYASIEARVLAWMAGEEWALQAFRDGRDIYLESAKKMSTPGNQLTRFQGKVSVLALGFSGGVNSLRAMGATGDDEELQQLVNVWRRANPRICRMWQRTTDVIAHGGSIGEHIRITRSGTDMALHLPSGRAVHYHDLRWEKYVVVDPRTKARIFKEGWRYADPKRGSARIGTYGGRIIENAVQAVARDVLAGALVRLEDAGYSVVGHVHDEILTSGYHLADVTRIMTQVPSWAPGLPLDAEGYEEMRYKK